MATLSQFSERSRASYSLVFRDAEILFLTKIRFVTLRYKNIKKSGIIFITTLCSHCSHNHKRSIAPIKANFIVALDRLLLIDYCITNPAVIK